MSATTRASLALTASTSLAPNAALEVVKGATARVKGGGSDVLFSGIQTLGAAFYVEREADGRLELSLNSGKRIIEICTFPATVTEKDGTTQLKVGGLTHYKTSQPTALGFIPVGPKSINGLGMYKRFLDEVSVALKSADGNARVAIEESA
ncbi:hypothetical protein [Cryptosporangium phraense]|uniref:Uncharacterized protein n=1 Tax=Cryptosporangium phraense TaxID=2593070 RepID=A0A545AQB6_9ACTN|nr:hypothetical protein [Cryptosporangium phraense]TQS43441.1 hypothetical protein FL583_19615 [Cryptosporangium phraense]